MYAIGVHQHIVQIPQIDVRQVLGQDLLDLVVDDLAFCLIESAAAFANQFIDARIGVEGAIGALGSEAGGVEDVLEDVGIEIAAPTQRSE